MQAVVRGSGKTASFFVAAASAGVKERDAVGDGLVNGFVVAGTEVKVIVFFE